MPVGGTDDLKQQDNVPSDEEDTGADPTYLVPQEHGRFALRWSRLPLRLTTLPRATPKQKVRPSLVG